MKKKKKKWLIAVVVVAVLAVVVVSAKGSSGTNSQYTEVAVQVKDMSSYLEFSGNVEASETANVYADASAKVLELKVAEGDEVKAGDVIAILDSSDVEYNISLKEASLAATNTSNYYNIKDSQDSLEQYQETLDEGLALSSAQQTLVSAQTKYQEAVETYNTALSEYQNGENSSIITAQRTVEERQREYEHAVEQHDDGLLGDYELESYEINLAQAQQDLASAKEDVEDQIQDYLDAVTTAEQSLADAERSYESSLLSSEQKVESYENNIEKTQALADTTTSEMELAHLKESLADYTIYAPMDGTITTLNIKEGNYTAAGSSTVAEIQNFDTMEISVKIDEQNIGNIHVGDAVSVYIDALDKTYDGSVAEISKTAVKSNNAVYVEATVEFAADDDVRSGFSAEVKLVKAAAENALCIPIDAVQYDTDNTAYVYLKGEDGELVKQTISLGLSDTSMIQVTEGLTESDIVMQEVTQTVSGFTMEMDAGAQQGGGELPDGGGAPDAAQ